MATKFRIGKLPEAEPLLNDFSRLVQNLGFHLLDITTRHAIYAGAFPAPHRDPFDRLLAAQAQLESMVLLSKDPLLDQFRVNRLWSEPPRLP